MKHLFKIEIEDGILEELDYYENYGKIGDPDAGCRKCFFHAMCDAFVNTFDKLADANAADCLFPCHEGTKDSDHDSNRKVFVLKSKS